MTKLLFIVIWIINYHLTLGQVQAKVLYDFCSCDYSGLDNQSLLGIESQSYIEVISGHNEVKVFKRFELDTNQSGRISSEYIRIEADTFLLINYDPTTCFNRVIDKGTIYFTSNIVKVDSFERIDPSTYEFTGVIEVVRYRGYVKHGAWVERSTSIQSSGNYLHGYKHGIWDEYCPDKYSWKELLYEEGRLIKESEKNLALHLKDHDLVSIDSLLIGGNWYISTEYDSLVIFSRNGQYNHAKFEAGGIIKFYSHHGGVERQWELSIPDRSMIISGQRYEINWLRKDYIELSKKN